MSSRTDVTRKIVLSHNACWARGDLASVLSHYACDMVFTDHFAGITYSAAALHAHIAKVLQRSALDTLKYVDEVRVDGDTATLRYTETIRSASGEALLEISACDVVRVKDKKIIEINEYAVPRHAMVDTLQAPRSKHLQAEKIGLGARTLGYLLDDLQEYFDRGQPYLKPELSLQDVVDATGYSRNQLSFAFNQGLGRTFYDYVNEARALYVLTLQESQPERGVMELAHAAGFRSSSTFYSAFRKLKACSPRQYFSKRQP